MKKNILFFLLGAIVTVLFVQLKSFNIGFYSNYTETFCAGINEPGGVPRQFLMTKGVRNFIIPVEISYEIPTDINCDDLIKKAGVDLSLRGFTVHSVKK